MCKCKCTVNENSAKTRKGFQCDVPTVMILLIDTLETEHPLDQFLFGLERFPAEEGNLKIRDQKSSPVCRGFWLLGTLV